MPHFYLLTQTVFRMKSEDVYEEILNHKHLFDVSNFWKDFEFYDNQNEMVANKMKVVNKEIPINKFVGLKSKFHSMLSDGGKECNTAKGVNIRTEFKGFRDTLLN